MEVRDSVVELKETRLWKYLSSLDENYAQISVKFVSVVSPVLASIKDFFPLYTRHDAHHGFRVVLRIEQIVKDECLMIDNELSFTAQEVFLLIASAYAHDLGMAVFPGEKPTILKNLGIPDDDNWKEDKILQKYLRDEHSIRGEKFISDNVDKIGMPHNLIKPLGDLMKSHNLSVHDLEINLGKRFAAGEKETNLNQLASILCIADAIEFSDTRVVDGVLDKLSQLDDEESLTSYRENMKHICIGDSVAVGEKDHRVIFSGSFKDPDVLALAHNTIDLIEDWVMQYCDIDFRQTKSRLKIKPYVFSRDLNIVGFDFERLGIKVKKESVISLISSNSTWSNSTSVVFRELLQNSIEACRYREFHTPASKSYKPEISINFDIENNTVTIEDNGCGMSKNVILNHFLNVGNSRSSLSTYKSNNFSSIARFGIGFWSVFTISDLATIESSPFEMLKMDENCEAPVLGNSFNVSIQQFKDYIVFKPIKRKAGTKITLNLKEAISIGDLVSSFDKEVLCTIYPVKIFIDSKFKFLLPSGVGKITNKELFEARLQKAKGEKVKLFSKIYEKDEFSLSISLAYRINENDNITFKLSDNHQTILHLLPTGNLSEYSVHGFKVNFGLPKTCFELYRVGKCKVNIKNSEGLKFRLDRNSLIDNNRVEEIRESIANTLHDAYVEFLEENNSLTNEKVYNLNKESRLHGGGTMDNYTNGFLYDLLKNHPDLLVFKLIEIEKGKTLNNAKTIFLNVNELLTKDYEIWTLQNPIMGVRNIQAEQLMKDLYSFLSARGSNNCNMFLLESCIEGSLLFDNDKESSVFSLSSDLGVLNLMKMKTLTLKPKKEHSCVIAHVRGRWSGYIYEKEIEGGLDLSFVFLGRYRLIVKPNSEISQKIRQLNSEKRNFEIVEIAYLLSEAYNGDVDSKLKELFPQTFH